MQRLRRQGSIADRARAAAPRPAPAPRPPPAPPVTSPGKHRGCSTTIDLQDLPPLDSFPTQEAPSYDSVINGVEINRSVSGAFGDDVAALAPSSRKTKRRWREGRSARRKFDFRAGDQPNRTKGARRPPFVRDVRRRGRPPTKGKDPPADDDRVVIPTQNKVVWVQDWRW